MRQLSGTVIQAFEQKGLKLVGLKMMVMERALAEQHYAEHQGKSFFPGMVDFIVSGPIVAMVLEGPGAIKAVRDLMGATNPQDAAPGTIRGSLAVDITRNVVHGSDSPESASREIGLFFRPEELVSYVRPVDGWLSE
ncbi:MAG: nucleoside-diphosphate kinase [Firmicutes bacterium]|nr:nucleoside-diphosphate kinase [Bacillota bacterium]